MILEGDHSVIDAIKEKKRLMDAGEPHDHIRPLLVIDGGLMKGVYGAGAGLAFLELDLIKTFTSLVGISSGAPTVAYFVSRSKRGADILPEECCSKEFFNPWRFNNILNPEVIISTLQKDGSKPLDVERILKHEQDLYIGLTDYETAESVLLKPANEDELFESIRGSIVMPGLVKQNIQVRGRRYLDGVASNPHPIQAAIETITSTHVLVLTNQDKGTSDIPWLEKFINRTVLRWRFSPVLLRAWNNRRRTRHKFVERVLGGEIDTPVGLVWGNGSIGSFERDSKKVQNTIEASRQWWLKLLRENNT